MENLINVHATREKSNGFSFNIPLLRTFSDEVLIESQTGKDTIYAITKSSGDIPDNLPENFDGDVVNRTTTMDILFVIQKEIKKQLGIKDTDKYSEQVDKEAREIWQLIETKTEDFSDQFSACWVTFFPKKENLLNVSFHSEVYGPDVKTIDKLEEKFKQVKIFNGDRLSENPNQPNGIFIIICPKK